MRIAIAIGESDAMDFRRESGGRAMGRSSVG